MRKAASFLAISLVAAVISLATDAHAAAVAPTVTLRAPWFPSVGFGPVLGKVAHDRADNIYVVDVENRRIVRFDPKGENPQLITGNIAAQGQPYGLAVMNDGTLVVTFQKPAPKVMLFDSAGQLLAQPAALVAAKFQNPTAVTLDSQENIYVLDAGIMTAPVYLAGHEYFVEGSSTPCVLVFTKQGVAINNPAQQASHPLYPANSFGSASRLNDPDSGSGTMDPGQLMLPEGIFYDAQDKRIVIADSMNGRVQFFGAYDHPTPASRFAYLDSLGNFALPADPLHMTMPTGAILENASTGTRLYVVDKVLHRILVFDPVAKLLLKTIDYTTTAGLDLVYPRDIILHRGSLLVTNEQASIPANLRTLSLDGASWPPPTLTFTFDYGKAMLADANFPNLANRPLHKFPLAGTVTAKATVTYVNNKGTANQTSGTCSVADTGATTENYTCDVQLTTAQTDQVIELTAVSQDGLTTQILAAPTIPHINYTAGALSAGPTLVFDTIAPAERVRKQTTIDLTGTVDYHITAPTGKELAVEIYNDATKAWTRAIVDISGTQNAKTWRANGVPLADNAVNVLNATAFTELSSRTNSPTQSVTVDNTLPAVTVSILESTAPTLEQLQNVSGVVTDKNLASITVEVNGAPYTPRFDLINATTGENYFSFLAVLDKNDVNTVRVWATDLAGNESARNSYQIDLQPMKLIPDAGNKLTVTAAQQADNLFNTDTNASDPLPYSGTVPPGTTKVMFGNETAALASTTWTLTDTNYKKNTINTVVPVSIVATGPYGSISKLRTLFNSAAMPGVAITTPSEDVAVNTTTVTIQGTVTKSLSQPASAIPSVTIDMFAAGGSSPIATQTATVNSGTGAFASSAFTFPTGANGTYSFRITATNGAGQTTVAVRNIDYDTLKPSVGIAREFTLGQAFVQGYIEPGATLRVYKGGDLKNVLNVNGTVWSIPSGAYTDLAGLQVVATDVAGNTNTVNWDSAIPDADVDGDGVLRPLDAILALRAAVASNVVVPDADTLSHGDIGPLVNGVPAPDGLMTIEDAMLVLLKVEGKPWN